MRVSASLSGFPAALVGMLMLLTASGSVSAQYAFETPGHDHDAEGVGYFGSAKNDKGNVMADVTLLLESSQATFIFVTNQSGRFRGTLPLDIPLGAVSVKCSKEGFEQVRVSKRPGPRAKRPTVQVDCILRPATP